MSYLLSLAVTLVVFVLVLLALRVKTFTMHICMAGREYWRHERFKTKTEKDTIYTLYAGPVAFVVVR